MKIAEKYMYYYILIGIFCIKYFALLKMIYEELKKNKNKKNDKYSLKEVKMKMKNLK